MDYTLALFFWVIILTLVTVILWAKIEKLTHQLYGQNQLQRAINGSHAVGLRQMINDLRDLQKECVKHNLEIGLLKNRPPSYHNLDDITLDQITDRIINSEEEIFNDELDTSEEEFLEAQLEETEELQQLSQPRTKL